MESSRLFVQRTREGVNMGCLKGMIPQYMSYGPYASERASLVHVISSAPQRATEQFADALQAPICRVRPVREVKLPGCRSAQRP